MWWAGICKLKHCSFSKCQNILFSLILWRKIGAKEEKLALVRLGGLGAGDLCD